MQLIAVHIPPRCRAPHLPDAQSYDVVLEGSTVRAITPSELPARSILLPALADAHVHLDKNYSVQQSGAACGDLFTAIDMIQGVLRNASTADFAARMQRALHNAWQHGTRALRTHIDWMQADAPPALAVVEQLAADWQGKLQLQWVALTPIDTLALPEGAAIAAQVAQRGGLLGAFVYKNDAVDTKLRAVFALAKTHGLALDFHTDEGLDADATSMATIAELTIEFGMQGCVVCGHACSLSVQDDAAANDTLALCAKAQIHIVALPTTNLYLQGAWHRTPLERGITRVREAAAAGVQTSFATDNVQDAFYPYGNYDLLESFALGVQVAHLPDALDWLGAITVHPATAMGLAWDGRIAPGCTADLVVLAAADEYDLMSPRGRQRSVFRAGQLLE